MQTWLSTIQQIVSILGIISIIFAVIKFNSDRSVRNIQLMQRCIDSYKKWLENSGSVDAKYLEVIGEELFYFQRRLIDKRVAVEWIQGMIDLIQIFGINDKVLNDYNNQINLKSLPEWQKRPDYFARISFFIHPQLKESIIIPPFSDSQHSEKKRELAKLLFKRIRKYKY